MVEAFNSIDLTSTIVNEDVLNFVTKQMELLKSSSSNQIKLSSILENF